MHRVLTVCHPEIAFLSDGRKDDMVALQYPRHGVGLRVTNEIRFG